MQSLICLGLFDLKAISPAELQSELECTIIYRKFTIKIVLKMMLLECFHKKVGHGL